MTQNKEHKNAIDFCKHQLEGKKYNFRCKKEWNIARGSQINAIDLGCFRDNSQINAVGIEIESNRNFNKPQIRSNSEDLKAFSHLFSKSKTFHTHVDDIEKIDFDKELNQTPKFQPRPVISRRFRR